MEEMLRAVQQVAREHVFIGDERHYSAAALRHLQVSEVLLQSDPALVADAQFHAVMAAECLLKHLFSMVRFSAGWRANSRSDEEFGEVRLASKVFKHDVKKLGAFLLRNPELQGYRLLEELMLVLPAAGDKWNEDRYRPAETNQNRFAHTESTVKLVRSILVEMREGRHDS